MSERLRIAIVGFGNHVRKNMLRLFEEDGPQLKAICVRDRPGYAAAHPAYADFFTDHLESVLGDESIDAVYIATPISSHYHYAEAALRAGKHVLCEKPMTQHVGETLALAELARDKGLFAGEIAMYQFHAQYRWIVDLLEEKRAAGERLLGIRARFSIPELPASDIRYNKDLGGGALLDVGYYPLSLVASLLGYPGAVTAVGHVSDELGVDLNGQALLTYDDVGCHCFWAIGASYANEVELSFTRSTYSVPRAFSKPPEYVAEVLVTQANGQHGEPIVVGPDDQFRNIFRGYAGGIAIGDQGFYEQRLANAILNAQLLDEVRTALTA